MYKKEQYYQKVITSLLNGMHFPEADYYRPQWHVSAPMGLLNDPNGLVHHKGNYHLFYQWNPFSCEHGIKAWGHMISKDLVSWKHLFPALIPEEEYESHGCYSGSAIVVNDQIKLFYTGNVKFKKGRTAYQCLALLNSDGSVQKLGSVISLPKGYTGHVRDPKVWRYGENYYVVLGAQDIHKQGKVIWYRSSDLENWIFLGELAGSRLNGFGDFGYMWECPDLFHLKGKDVLLFCPQGLTKQNECFANLFQAGYVIGKLNYQTNSYQHGAFQELDLGFDFYAPQTMEDEQGRRILIGWMGLPDENEAYHPTIKSGWIHQMTCPRVLTLNNGKLCQQPVDELKNLRSDKIESSSIAHDIPSFPMISSEMIVKGEANYQIKLSDVILIEVNNIGLILKRKNWRTHSWESRTWQGTLDELHVLIDRSSIELFINNSDAVLSSRFFSNKESANISFNGEAMIHLIYWKLSK
ncbi:sucrose-6-phosphate hydrolase [Zooshikella ganghwensis]|uniref:sucrose-6-phosphate hydrolase n=1 Tax=Zooshikella ganghwensis TaxID=202772 RepID=UPI0004067C68|nr:sucrose-6-phosphate hydrolase [Zooshikella ganghwensis]